MTIKTTFRVAIGISRKVLESIGPLSQDRGQGILIFEIFQYNKISMSTPYNDVINFSIPIENTLKSPGVEWVRLPKHSKPGL